MRYMDCLARNASKEILSCLAHSLRQLMMPCLKQGYKGEHFRKFAASGNVDRP